MTRATNGSFPARLRTMGMTNRPPIVLLPGLLCDASIWDAQKRALEPYADIAWGATLVTASHDLDSPEFQTFGRRITICSHAWVAAGACVGPGVTIGEGAVLSAWGVAFRNLAPWTIHYGTPAQTVRNRKRFDAPGLSTPDPAEVDAAAPPPAGPDA